MNSFCEIKRPLCSRCRRAEKTCICRWIVDLASLVEVVILQHPLEANQVKGSASLLHLSLSNSQMHVGELFDLPVLSGVLYASGKRPILLYPAFNEAVQHLVKAPPLLSEEILESPENCRLIVLDSTWRKSRKMLYLNPLLQTLPRLSLSDGPASNYHIRKAHSEHQLSTLEASCYALMQLEKNTQKYKPLLDAFDSFVGQQMALREQIKLIP